MDNNQNQEYNLQSNQQLNYNGYNQQGYVPNNMYYNQPNQYYNMQNYYAEQQMQVNQQIIAQQQQQIQQLMQQQQYMQANQQVNQQIPVQQYGTSNKINVSNFDISKFKIKNMYSLIAAIILFCGLIMGSMFIVTYEYSSEIDRYNVKETSDVFEAYVLNDREQHVKVDKSEWFASKLYAIIIIAIIIFVVGAFINIGTVRIVASIILTITYICTFAAVVNIEVQPGFSFLILLAGVITSYISFAEKDDEINDNVIQKEFKLSADSSDSSQKTWKCIECGRENPKYLTTCKCGTSKPS